MITLKNSVGRVLLAGLIYMVTMMLAFIVIFDPLIGAIAGVCAGIAFTLTMIIINARNIKIGTRETEKIAEEKRVLCNGSAESMMGKIFGNAGWLILCENELIFKSNKLNFDNRSITIPLERIRNLTTTGNRKFVVECIDKTFTFNVVKAKQWREIAHNHIISKMNEA